MFCLQQSLGLEESINLLSSNEKPTVQESAASVRDQSRGRRGGRGNRGRGGTSGSGRGSSSNRGSRSQSNSNRSQSSLDKVEKSRPMCYWCEKKGHRQQDCKRYLAAKKRDKQSKDGQA